MVSDLMVNTEADSIGFLEIPGFTERVDVVLLSEADPEPWAGV